MAISEAPARPGQTTREPADLSWQNRAACNGTNVNLFYGSTTEGSREYPPETRDRETRDRETRAKSFCRDCPVRTACLQYALDTGEKFGIWGGLDPDERKRYRRNKSERQRQARRKQAAA
jgi:WhiB family redox-sensing transcriptional regulator